ncbi:DUF4268 domain-containing protein, partial [Dolichospermum sp. ST_sed3]|nr:DUF4268 domain-containing protein [Dolichospermum sp. ST_sed3]
MDNKTLYTIFFTDLQQRLIKSRPDLFTTRSISGKNWHRVCDLAPNAGLAWTFRAYGKGFDIGVYLKSSDRAENKSEFDRVFAHKKEIEARLDRLLQWDRQNEGDIKQSQIYIRTPGIITDPPEKLEELKKFVVEQTGRFA